ncbi:MAG: molybdopterin-guanine dinucleotide biosynthesis protein B [Deltaproteobacteria bacterium]|nr:molybdopterin-guanine dinucleotide biosynthesis protein B [Deltaproteobacteria bacterium]
MTGNSVPIILLVGRSNAGKTTLLEKLLPELRRLDLKIGTIKHDVHGFDIDHPGKDSYRHKKAGAAISLISSPNKLAVVADTDHDHSLDELVKYFAGVDLIVTEGYKRENKPKVEIFRPEAHPEPLCTNDPNLVAVVTDADIDLGVPKFGLEQTRDLAKFLKDKLKLPAASCQAPSSCKE